MLTSVHVYQEGADYSIDTRILFDKYEVLSLLGVGASSQVYLVRHMKLGTNRAVKCISKTRSMPSKLSYEADLLKNLTHPGIPIIYDIEEDESYFYIIEEYVSGESLNEFLLHQNNISQRYIMQLGVQLCEILHYLHTRKPYPILYQDLKPEHIILCGEQVKLVDFGIAAYIGTWGNEFQNYGTVEYAAPEQSEGKKSTVATDVYSVGCILTLLADQSLDKCSKKFYRIIQKACARKPEERYRTIDELQNMLTKELEHTCRSDKAKPSGRKHLLPIIAVVGAKKGIGATHIAVALTSYLNWRGFDYQYMQPEDTQIADVLGTMQTCSYEYFRAGIQPWNEEQEGKEECVVLDCGEDIKIAQLADADLIILVVSGRIWEMEETEQTIRRMGCEQNLVLLCNYHDREGAQVFAKKYKREVYCFPLDENPFAITGDKKKLFAALLKKEGG